MPNKTSPQSLEYIQGSVERVTFHSEETGFCVLRTKVKGRSDLTTVIGSAASIAPGEYLECSGAWINNKQYGLQFKAETLKVVPPSTLEGIEKYLGSGMIRGIGAHFAKKLIKAFGEAVFDIIEHEPQKLTDLEGIGKKRKAQIITAWAEQKSIRNIMVFLQSYGVGTSRAVRIYKTYGENAIERVRENPYRLALDIRGIGFKTADALAEKLGIAKDSMIRAQAGVRHVLQELCDNGHCAAEYERLIKESVSLLEISETIIRNALKEELIEENVVEEDIDNASCIFPISLHQAESTAAKHLLRILKGNPPWEQIDEHKAIPWIEQKTNLELSLSQKQAIANVLKNKLSIITGGPGVGKTTIVDSIIKIIRAKNLAIALCAPTGRAAKRLSETTNLTAKTIHRLLEFEPRRMSFKHNQEKPLPIDVLVIDEASMLDIVLLYHLLKAVPDHTAVLFVGDVDQLPSVGSGAVLTDMIRSNIIPTVRLTEIFRQAANSKIIINAHRINQGQMPVVDNAPNNDFYTLYAETPEDIHDRLINMVTKRIPNHFNCNAISSIQVLTPMNRGGLGAKALNAALQQELNGNSEPKISRYGTTFAPGDKVIQNVNNYDKEVFNGDIGKIASIDLTENIMNIAFDNRLVEYDFNELDEISLAYAISIHKSQGSEFPIVVMPLATQHYVLLARNLLYTGITRGKNLVVLIGQKKAVAMAIRNNKEKNRLTKLAQRLRGKSCGNVPPL